MKRLTALVLAILAIFLLIPSTAFAADEPKSDGKSGDANEFNGVKIVFNVGDSTLSINDKEITVETPYVVDGVTLVPVRVITEAFGAEVGWIQETKTVTITYSGVVLKLAIGDKNVYINGVKTELLAAPELKNSTTMVPLRFITESFGADVTYDEKTKGIAVTKEMTKSNSIKDFALIMKHSTKERVGDSYFSWSIKKTADMNLASRSFNGDENYFATSENGGIYINVYDPLTDDENNLDFYMDKLKEFSKDYTVMNYEKAKSSSGVNYAKLQFKSSEAFGDIRFYISDKKVYYISVYEDISKGMTGFNQTCALVDSFDLTFDNKTTEDLSDIDKETNMRVFNSKDMAFRLSIPGNFSEVSDPDISNEFSFISLENGSDFPDRINVEVYSSFENHTYQTWANNDKKRNINSTNSKYFSYSDLDDMEFDGKKALYYQEKMNYKSTSTTRKDIFIDAGDYFYNISISLRNNDSSGQLMQSIIDSFKIGKINGEEIGKMMRTDGDEIKYKEYTESSSNLKVSVPSTWKSEAKAGSLGFYNEDTGLAFYAYTDDISDARISFSEICDSMYTSIKKDGNIESTEMTLSRQNGIGDEAYSFAILEKAKNSNISDYEKIYLVKKGETLYTFIFIAPEISWGNEASETATKIVSTAQFGK